MDASFQTAEKVADLHNRFHYRDRSKKDHKSFLNVPRQPAGNLATQRLLRSGAIQPKLAISQPNDVHEQEADRIAEQVIRTPESTLRRTCGECENGGMPCPKCEWEKPLQRKTENMANPTGASVPNSFIQSLGSGQRLDVATRAFFEPRFGQDFSRVRVHSGAAAEQSARDVNAHAYTVGPDIVFGVGGFNPRSDEGRRLLAHELAHVVQQSGAGGTDAGQANQKCGLSPLFGDPALRPIILRQIGHLSIQRQADFGLAMSQNVSGYATKVKAFTSEKANQSKSFEDLARFAIGVCNDELKAMDIPPIVNVEFGSGDFAAAFSKKDWKMFVNSTKFTGKSVTIGQLTKPQIAELVEAIYHEARHAEQYYKIARLLAGQKKSELEIEFEAQVPKKIAEQAKAKPLAAIEPAEEFGAILLAMALYRWLGDNPEDISKRTQDIRKSVARDKQEFQQVQDWYREAPLINLIYDYDFKIRGYLFTVEEQAKKRRTGSWDITKLQPAIDGLNKDVLLQIDTEIKRVSGQKDRSKMVAHLVKLKTDLTELIGYIQQQTTQQQTNTPILELIEVTAKSIRLLLKAAYEELLIEVDAYKQATKVRAAIKEK